MSAKVLHAAGLIRQGRLDQARAVLLRALEQSPADTDANSAMSFLLAAGGEDARAQFYARRALDSCPDDPNLLDNLGGLLLRAGDPAGAADLYGRSLAAMPGRSASAVGLSAALCALGRPDEAVLATVQGGAPDAALDGAAASGLLQCGRVGEAISRIEASLARHPRDLFLLGLRAAALNSAPDAEPQRVFRAHQDFAAVLEAGAAPLPRPAADPQRRLRLGLVSGDLRQHAIATFLLPLLEHLDRAAMEVFCYSTSPLEDETSGRIRRAAGGPWRRVTHEPDAALADLVRRDRIDILIDLAGHTPGNRLAVFAARPAPVQVTWLGYPNTTGLTRLAARLVDSITDPPGAADALASERLIRLDPCFLCYRPPVGALELDPGEPQGPLTFACFARPEKLGDASVRLWARTLAAAPGSRLLLRTRTLARPAIRDRLLAALATAGVGTERVVIEIPSDQAADMLRAYTRVDVALDPAPYNGTTMTCEALCMGVPVVTLAGRAHAARVGASLLAAAGRPQWVARSEAEYASIAAGLGRQTAGARRMIREGVLGSALCDARAFARRFGDAMRNLWRDACAGPSGERPR